MAELSVMLIGAGVIAQHHANAAQKLGQPVRLCATDPNPGAVSQFKEKFPAACLFADVNEMLAQRASDDDIVIVATPPFAHYDATIASLKSGRHVLCEKPLAMSRQQASQMLDLAKKRDRLLGCCSTRFRALAATAEVRRMMDAGELGNVYHINWINRRQRIRPGIEYQPQSRWFLDPTKSGGGVVMDWAPYDFAAITELFEPVRLDVKSAWFATPATGADPSDFKLCTEHHAAASMVLHRREGTTIPITYERAGCTHGEERFGPQIEGTHGAVKWDWLGGGKLHHSRDVGGKVETTTSEHPDAPDLGPHDKPLVYFHRRVTGQPSPAILNEQAMFNFSCIRAIYDAAATSEPQTVRI
jgi:predicted dehydrogenase